MEALDAMLLFAETLGRLREVVKLSWFATGGSSDELIAIIEPAVLVEHLGGGRAVYRGGRLSALSRRYRFLDGYLYTLLPYLRLSEALLADTSYLFPLSTIVAAAPLEGDRVEVAIEEGVQLVSGVRRNTFLREALLSTRLTRMYDAVSTRRDCSGSFTVVINGVTAQGYTIPAFAKCMATGRLAPRGAPPLLQRLRERLERLSEDEVGELLAAASNAIALISANGLLELRSARSVLENILAESRG